jgi:3-phenylpropionate/cinnamic acid dioxygenase small subunit
MTTVQATAEGVQAAASNDRLEAMAQQHAVEQFLYAEAHLLDSWQWSEWLDLFSEDVRYWMPIRKNRLRRQREADERPLGVQVALFDDDYKSLELRVRQMNSGKHWAEDPPSRCRHLVTNTRVEPVPDSRQLNVRSNFIVYRNRLESEVDVWVGERLDVLRPNGDSFKIAGRTVLLDQNVVISKNLSVFF